MNKSILFLSVIVFLSASICSSNTGPNELIQVFNSFKKAATTGKESEIAKYLSLRFINSSKNNYASIGEKLSPDAIKDFADNYDISKGKVIKTIENGPTIGLILDIPTTEMDGKNRLVEYLILKFVKEDSTWKYDLGISTSKHKLDDKGKPTVFVDSLIPKEIAIDGIVLKAPALLPLAEIRANYSISAEGYKVKLTVNGNEPVFADEGSASGILIGGIKNGNNEIELTITKFEARYDMYPRVTIIYAGKNNQEITAYELDHDAKVTGTIKASFTANSK